MISIENLRFIEMRLRNFFQARLDRFDRLEIDEIRYLIEGMAIERRRLCQGQVENE